MLKCCKKTLTNFTSCLLQQGMCGGPVVTLDKPNTLLGIIYGVINHTTPAPNQQPLSMVAEEATTITKDETQKGKVVSIPASTIAQWLYGSIEGAIAKSSNAAMEEYKKVWIYEWIYELSTDL
jgi:hypothetical protein